MSGDFIRNIQVFQFFCPLEKLLDEKDDYGGAWGLLGSLAYFLMPGQDEEEVKFHLVLKNCYMNL